MEIIVTHINADFDAFASMVAAKRLYPGAALVFPGSQEKKVRDFIGFFHPVDIKRVRDIDLDRVERLIIVDTRRPERIGPFAGLTKKKDVKIHIYDHHPLSDGDIRGAFEAVEEVGATATILTGILRERGLQPTAMEATVLALGIYEETGSLLFTTTTERDVQAVAYLIRRGASLKIVSAYMKTELGPEELDLLNELIQTSREVLIDGTRVLLARASRDGYSGEGATLAHRIMDMTDADALILMLGLEDRTLMVGRSRAPELDVSAVLSHFGGGGHRTAASATVKEEAVESLEEEVVKVLRNTVRPVKAASDIMTRPVLTITSTSTIKKAETIMTKYGVNVLPVVKDDSYRGIISREAVEKALFHGFGKIKVMDFTTTDAPTAEKDTPLRDVETVMVERNQRFMPVLEKGMVVGAITRTDLLRGMYEDYLKRSGAKEAMPERTAVRDLSALLKIRFPEEIFDLLNLAGETADSTGCMAYLVGGSVRDLLRGEENLDIDIVIEGDGIAFAEKLGTRLAAKVKTHDRFQTAKVIKGELKVDVATARTEYYESPAALPRVEVSSIKKDLYRRDFTINTLAVRLNPSNDFGRLVDFFGGQRDLKEKTIRVLHDLSFVEDPTRAFRAMRFAVRFGFKLSKHTENLIKSALKMNLFEKLSGSRLYEELMLAFSEADAVSVIRRLSDYRLLRVIQPQISMTESLGSLLSGVHDTLLWFNLSFMEEKPDRGALYLMALISGLKDEGKEAALKRLAVPQRKKASIIEGIKGAGGVLRVLPLQDPASIYDVLSPLAIETVLFAMALAPKEAKKEISRYLLEFRKTRPFLTGDDLKRMGIEPGPVYAKILKDLLHERLRGRLRTKEDEKRFVAQRIKVE